jgi:general secretion pathway protein C
MLPMVILCLLFITLSEAYTKPVSSLELKGTIFDRSLKPAAIIKDTATGRVNMYETGEIIGKAKIIEIKRAEIILQEGQAIYTLALPGGSVAQPALAGLNNAEESKIFCISRIEINQALSNVPQVMRNVKVMPYYQEGRPQGISLCNIKDGSILQKAGVRSGDIVKSVNGMNLNTPYQIFQAYKKLKDNKNLKVELLRESKPVTFNYIIE